MPTRRTLLVAAGGGLALVAAGGFWRAMRVPETARGPWDLAGEPPADLRLDAFRHAILAPNPHNRQPWRIRLEGADGATLLCDLDRRLPETDPFDRQILIGFGAFLELAAIAASNRGASLEVVPFPEGEPGPRLDARPVARLAFAPRASADPLFAEIPKRRTNKEPYDPLRPIAADALAALTALAPGLEASTDPSRVAAIRAIVLEALDIEMDTPRTHRESVELIRIGARAVDAQPDGIALTGPTIELGAATGMIDSRSLADPASSAFSQGRAMMHRSYGSAPGFLWLTTPSNSRLDQLAAGRAWARLNLTATRLGLSVHPASQALQEYPEMAPLFQRLHALLAPAGGRVQMLARIGHGPAVPPAPRYPLEAKLVRT